MRYRFKIKVNVKNDKIIDGLYDTEHGDAEAFPDEVHESDLALELSKLLGEPLTKEDIFILEMNLLEDRGIPERKRGKLSIVKEHGFDDLSF